MNPSLYPKLCVNGSTARLGRVRRRGRVRGRTGRRRRRGRTGRGRIREKGRRGRGRIIRGWRRGTRTGRSWRWRKRRTRKRGDTYDHLGLLMIVWNIHIFYIYTKLYRI